ncbi:hypothetical protein KIPB_004222 [Kipferlia bialata]|uniref:Uncharacterized protein n=1 Tax=Kipferlia bialata TaxID=797122 RepID=A0A391NKH3_9EUKA|nr:hypothetical protein KIPB_004222 [Kipferlia bialata]|eukprot:g4222.t1
MYHSLRQYTTYTLPPSPMHVDVSDMGGRHLCTVQVPGDLSPSDPISAMQPMIHRALRERERGEGEASDSDACDMEMNGEGNGAMAEAASTEAGCTCGAASASMCEGDTPLDSSVPTVTRYTVGPGQLEVSPSTPLAFLHCMSSVGTVHVTACFDITMDDDAAETGVGKEESAHHSPLTFTAPECHSLLSLPNSFGLDSSAVVVYGDVVNALSLDRGLLVTAVGGRVRQSLVIDTAALPGTQGVVCTKVSVM